MKIRKTIKKITSLLNNQQEKYVQKKSKLTWKIESFSKTVFIKKTAFLIQNCPNFQLT
jgi:hypothetical protein